MESRISFNLHWNYRLISTFAILLLLPNFLGMLNLTSPWGFKIHFFQIAVILAALIYGPKGGFLSGLIGSVYSAITMNNPYLIVGNAILGFFVGLFAQYGLHTVAAVLIAYLVQLPWLILSDYYLVGLPMSFIISLVMAMTISNLIWSIIVHYSIRPIKQFLQ